VIFRFFKLTDVRHLGFVWAYLDHPRRLLGDLYHRAKLVVINAVVANLDRDIVTVKD